MKGGYTFRSRKGELGDYGEDISRSMQGDARCVGELCTFAEGRLHSSRNARVGSMRAARQAGTALAVAAIAARTTAATTSVGTS